MEPIENVDEVLNGLPPILAAEDVSKLVQRLLAARCQPLVFYARDDVAAMLRAVLCREARTA